MMAEFPPNLEDGELWLPSDIFVNEVPSEFHSRQCPCMDDVGQNFGAAALQYPPGNVSRPTFYSSNNFEGFKWFRPPVRDEFIIAHSAWPSGLNRNVYGLCGSTTGYYADRPELSSKLFKPTRSQVDYFQEMRRRVLQSQQNRQQNHLLPFQGIGIRRGGFVRESGGTGVFHPRALTTATPTAFSTSYDFRRELGVRNRHEARLLLRETPF